MLQDYGGIVFFLTHKTKTWNHLVGNWKKIYTLHWFDGEAAPKIVDVVEQGNSFLLSCQHIIVLLLYLKRLYKTI